MLATYHVYAPESAAPIAVVQDLIELTSTPETPATPDEPDFPGED